MSNISAIWSATSCNFGIKASGPFSATDLGFLCLIASKILFSSILIVMFAALSPLLQILGRLLRIQSSKCSPALLLAWLSCPHPHHTNQTHLQDILRCTRHRLYMNQSRLPRQCHKSQGRLTYSSTP